MKSIQVWGIKQNNLKDIQVDVPLGSFTVVCGPSGSGKSSLAFETLFAEGQRRYIESLNNYARQFLNKAPKPDIEGIKNIPPSIAIEQKNSVKTSRSTVGTTTEIIDYLRLLFEKVGRPVCPTLGFAINSDSPTEATLKVIKEFSGARAYVLAPVESKDLQGTKLTAALMADGFARIWVATSKAKPAKAASVKAKVSKKKVSKKKATVVAKAEPCQNVNETEMLGEIVELTPRSVAPEGRFYVVADRMAISPDDRIRLSDSIEQAYRLSRKFNGQGEARVVTTDGKWLAFSEDNSCARCGYRFPTVSSQLFSFNSPVGACPTCNGFGNVLQLDEAKVVPNSELTLAQGALHPFTMPSAASDRKVLREFCKKENIDMHIPWSQMTKIDRDRIWKGEGKFYGVEGLFEYLETKKYKMHVRVFLSRYKSAFTCKECKGTRLKAESRYIRVGKYNIQDLSLMTLGDLANAMNTLELSAMDQEKAHEILRQIRGRLKFLLDVGVEYLTLDRPTRTLSGGEYQRLSLAKQLGMGLSQILYVLDEPTVGLHPRDNDRLIGILKQLNQLGNTLVVVEHDQDVIRNATHVIEMGPGSGHLGGKVVFAGLQKDFITSNSTTARYLHGLAGQIPMRSNRPVDLEEYRYFLELVGCTGHNLKNVDIRIPLNRLVTVTGVSGSGKSTLVGQTLYPAIAAKLGVEYIPGQPYRGMIGADHLKGVLLIDQSPIGKSARSNPVTYLKVYDTIRNVFATLPESKERGYSAGTFSLNVDGGRCPICKGLGFEVIDMMFMDDVQLVCEACDGKKFRDEILEIRYQNKNIHEVLNMTVQEAMDFFVSYPQIRKPLSFLKEVGLEYICLGQAANTLSGGESQRLKIARELINTHQKATLYILDEPTTGLHFREIEMLMRVLHRLVEAGGSVLLVEHNLEVIKSSDYIIDLGPEAGAGGGLIVAQGTPYEIIQSKKSHTGRYLKAFIEGRMA